VLYKDLTFYNFKFIGAEAQPFSISFKEDQKFNGFNVDVIGRIVTISGHNGIGKTTILDAITFLFTNKLWNGKSVGWENLNEKNEPTGLKPYIKLNIVVDNFHKIEVVLNNGKRFINGVVCKTNAEFNETLLKVGLNIADFLLASNPFYLMNYISTNDARMIVINKTMDENFWRQVNINFLKNDLLTIYDDVFVNEILLKIKLSTIDKIISSNETDLKFQKTNITSLNNNFARYKTNNKLTEEEHKQYEEWTKYESLLDKQNSLKRHYLQVINNVNKICPVCKSAVKIDLNAIADANKDLAALTLIDDKGFDANVFNIYKMRINNYLLEASLINLEKEVQIATDKLKQLNQINEIAKIYKDVQNKLFNTILNKTLPFSLKLFHKNKTSEMVREVFTVTVKGVDYIYLNTSLKYKVGVDIIKFLFPGIELPLLIDNLESLDSASTSDLQQYSNQIIGVKVT